jgi:fructose-1,6-bisphosphatase II
MGGEILGRLSPRNDAERDEAIKAGYDLSKVLTTNDLVRGNDVFFAATGVTDGELLRGVRYDSYGARSHSLVMRSRSGTIRYIDTHHRHDRLTAYFSTSDS